MSNNDYIDPYKKLSTATSVLVLVVSICIIVGA